MKSSLRFWELQFLKSHMTPDVAHFPINSSLQFLGTAVLKISYNFQCLMKASLRFWELQFSKSHMTPDIVYVPFNSSLRFWELQFSKCDTTSDV